MSNLNGNKKVSSSEGESSGDLREHTQANAVRALVDLISRDAENSFDETDRRLIKASLLTFIVWFCLTGFVLAYSPKDSFERVSGTEREVCSIAFVLLLVSNISRLFPLLYHDNLLTTSRQHFFKNGFVVSALTIQTIAMVACGLMAFFPTPILIDHVTGARCFLVRWCEWAPLAFLLTFLAEETDIPNQEKFGYGLLHALLQGMVVSTGFVFPIIRDSTTWFRLAAVDITAFCFIYVRIHQKWVRFQRMSRSSERNSKPVQLDRIRLSVRSMKECAFLWSLLVVLHFLAAFAPKFLPEEHLLNTPALPMIAETLLEVLSKHMHIGVLEACFATFSEKARRDEILHLLRRTMSVVWERSSDTIVIMIKRQGKQMVMVSPTFYDLVSPPNAEHFGAVAIVFEVPLEEKDAAKMYCISLDDDLGYETLKPSQAPEHLVPGINSLAQMLAVAWESSGSSTMMHDFASDSNSKDAKIARCEVTFRKLKETVMVGIIRDVSERLLRFEAEKQLAVETTERQKDSETNRFTRHEIKVSWVFFSIEASFESVSHGHLFQQLRMDCCQRLDYAIP